jgi:hypothetical protein
MRGEGTTSHPPSRNFHYFVARGIRFSFQNQSVVFAIPWNVRSGVWLHENMSMIDATAKRDRADEETRS